MTVDSNSEREETLSEFLASRARRASDTRLAAHAVAAVVALIAIVFWRGPGWDIRLSVAVGLLAFAVWGVADRDLAQQDATTRRARYLRAARALSAVAGYTAGAYLLMALLARMLGRIIS